MLCNWKRRDGEENKVEHLNRYEEWEECDPRNRKLK